MLYYIIALFAIIFIVSLIYLPKNKVNQKTIINKLAADSYASGLRSLARHLRTISRVGDNVTILNLLGTIDHAYKQIANKISKNTLLLTAERNFYDNYFKLTQGAHSFNCSAVNLAPRSHKAIRIVALAEYIIEHSQDELNLERLKSSIEIINSEVPLTFKETYLLKDALLYVVIKNLYIAARRIIWHNKIEKIAKRKYLDTKYLSSDIYVYYYSLKISDKDVFFDKLGIKKEQTIINYQSSLYELQSNINYLFNVMDFVKEKLTIDVTVKYPMSYELISLSEDLSKMSIDTVLWYLNSVYIISEYTNSTERYIIKVLREMSTYNKVSIAKLLANYKKEVIKAVKSTHRIVLIPPKKPHRSQLVYILANVLGSLSAIIGTYFLTYNILFTISMILPLYFSIQLVLNHVLEVSVSPRQMLKMNKQHVDEENRTLVVRAVFIPNVASAKESVKSIKKIREVNIDKNIIFSLLVDLKGADTMETAKDDDILAELAALSIEGYNVFVRKRTLDNGKFIAKERKRGAVMDLVEYLEKGNREKFRYIAREDLSSFVYIMTLDEDNIISTNAVLDAVNVMSHPINKEVELLALKSHFNMFSINNSYSKHFLYESGFVSYPNYTTLFYNLFGVDIFCGKGLIKIKPFYNKIFGVFPEKKLLSHDIIEGAILNTSSYGITYEDAPNSFISDVKRKNRWLRGDVGLLQFLSGRFLNPNKEKVKIKTAPIYKWLMVNNFLNALYPMGILISAIIAITFSLEWVFLTVLGLPFVSILIKNIASGTAKHTRCRYIFTSIIHNWINLTRNIVLIPFFAINNIIVIAKTIYQIMTKKNLLEWKTFKDLQNTIEKASPPIEAAKMMEYAKATYKYFDYMTENNLIIGDNLQIKPYKGIAKMTSPTNMAFDILSLVEAFYLKFIDLEEASLKLYKKLNAISSLATYKGNLYNWYDIVTLVPLNKFVSSVDQGNFLAAIITCRQFAAEQNINDILQIAERLIKQCDLLALYDRRKDMFYIGIDASCNIGTGHYDLLASESRILSYIFAALYRNAKNYISLARDTSPILGNTLYSWSGTTFEYAMPSLFLDYPKDSLIGKSTKNVAKLMRLRGHNGTWGMSESAYYRFDDNLRYQYKAFGLKEIAFGVDAERRVYSPYSAFLLLKYYTKKCINNIRRMDENGMISEFGFYEAIDMEGERRIIKNIMTHHQGMILTSLTNYLVDDIVKKLFMSYSAIGGSSQLLAEPNITTKCKKTHVKYSQLGVNKYEYYKNIDNIEYYSAILGDANAMGVYQGLGNAVMYCDSFAIGRDVSNPYDIGGAYFYVQNNDKICSPTFLPLESDANAMYKYTFKYSGNKIVYNNSLDRLSKEIIFDDLLNIELTRLTVAKKLSGTRVAYFDSITLGNPLDRDAHPAFFDMFITTEYIEEYKAIVATRSLKNGKDYLYAAIVIEGMENIVVDTNRANVLKRNYDASFNSLLYRTVPVNNSLGSVLYPCFSFGGKIVSDKMSVYKLFSKNKDELIQKIKCIPKNYFNIVNAKSRFKTSFLASELSFPLEYGKIADEKLINIDNSGRREEFLDYKGGKACAFVSNTADDLKAIKLLLSAVKDLTLINKDFYLYIIIEKTNKLVSGDVIRHVNSYISDRVKVLNWDNLPSNFFDYMLFTFNATLELPKLSILYRHLKEFGIKTIELDLPAKKLESGQGYFDERNNYVLNTLPLMPYSNVIALANGGILTTENGEALSYFFNSRERKNTLFCNDPISNQTYDNVFLDDGIGLTKISGGVGKNKLYVVGRGESIYKVATISFNSTYSVFPILNGDILVKLIDINTNFNHILIYELDTCMGANYGENTVYSTKIGDNYKVKNIANNQELFIKLLDCEIVKEVLQNNRIKISFRPLKQKVAIVMSYKLIGESLSINLIDNERIKTIDIFDIANKFKLYSNTPSLDILFNNYLLYQVVSSRLNGKLGFYQVGGATGFRDQLQDSLALLYNNSQKVKEQILYSARHQYTEGDVMHWWHHEKFGLRTKISDDKLYLPYVVSEYIDATGDVAILTQKEPFLVSEKLGKNEHCRFENPEYTSENHTILEHCNRAFNSASVFGEHYLVNMGSGDWNDGIDYITSKGKGESVMLSMFLYQTIMKFSPYFTLELRDRYTKIAEKLKHSVNKYCYKENQFLRLYGDNGIWYGDASADVYNIDLTVQSYSVLSEITDADRQNNALKSAEMLIDREKKIIKLLSPPLDEKNYIGYISAYPKGVRENGGQYTHGAIWYLMALVKNGQKDLAYDLLNMINPINKCMDKAVADMYKGEPYVLSGDVYSSGSMGWSWYTGSAAWCYRLILESFLGIKMAGDKLTIEPSLPKNLEINRVEYLYGNAINKLFYIIGTEDKIMVDNREIVGNTVALDINLGKTISIFIDKKRI